MSEHCPRCDSPAPHLHPAMQHEGEVQPCPDAFHFRETPQNTAANMSSARHVLNATPAPSLAPRAGGEEKPMKAEGELCSRCGGNGTIKIRHGISVCPRCNGDCWEPEDRAAQDRAAVRAWLDSRVARHQAAYDAALAEGESHNSVRAAKLRVHGMHLEVLRAERDALREGE